MTETGAAKVPDDTPLDVACVIGCAVQTGAGAVLNTARVEPGAALDVLEHPRHLERLLAAVPSGARLVALDERGTSLTSGAFAELLGRWRDEGIADLAFVIGGVLMIGVAYVMSMGSRVARLVALLVLLSLVVVFGYAVSQSVSDASQLTAYGFIAGGLVIGIAVLFSGSLREAD